MPRSRKERRTGTQKMTDTMSLVLKMTDIMSLVLAISLVSLTLSVLALIGAGVVWGEVKKERKVESKPTPPPKMPWPGECPHTSSKKLKVTSMGDKEDYYLCKLCNEKVKASELYYFEKGGV